MNDDVTRHAPIAGCNCAACEWATRKATNAVRGLGYPGYRPSQDADLELNYRRFEQGLLVSKDTTG
jgi:hypothetical protein